MYYLKTTPRIVRLFHHESLIWDISTETREVFITFDDGPHESITPWCLDQLSKFNAKGTFFCVGENVEKNPIVFNSIINAGQDVGNHTYNHLNGWNSPANEYIDNIKKAHELIQSNLFRPPYGRIRKSQADEIFSQLPDYKIFMWSILSSDFDKNFDGTDCFNIVKKNIKPGSIIVFHDSEKAFPRLKIALPLTLQYLTDLGFECNLLSEKCT